MATGYGPQPSNKIVVDGKGKHVQMLKVETATNMYPGRLVKKGTNDDDIVVATANSDVIGWLGYLDTIKKHRPATVDTIYLINAQVAVLHGPGMIVLASLKDGETITKGEKLVADAAGELVAAAAITATVPSGSTAVTSTSAQPAMTMAGSIPAAGIIVAIAEESVTSSGSSEDIMVRSLI